MTTLVVVAHPDDEVLGCGGTIARLTAEGEQVHVVILSFTRAPVSHSDCAVEHLGGSAAHHLFPDQHFDTVPLFDITKAIESVIAGRQPDTVYTHHPGDLNQDHVITSRAVLTACRPVNGCPVKTVYAMEIPSSTEWGDGTFHPNTYVDVTATLDRKVAAMEMYETERREFPHPRSPEALRALAAYRGASAGVEAAEAFQLLRQIRA